ncbi:MAG: hypothetical protein II656_05610 [Ruminococcus sp.]|nr:hypothetical protein [Ruminococcus sp.]
MKKQIALLTSAVLAVSMVTSCGKNNSSSQTGHKWENSETLNEWQKSLLEAQGLPTDIEQLSPTQKRSIQHIYEMITYLNEKYGEEFVYAGYVEPGVMDEETLYARSLSDKKQRAVTVKIDSDGDFTDDYMGSSVADYCENLIGDYVRSYFDSKDVAYFMSVNTNRLDSIKEVENGDFNWDIGVNNQVIFSNKSYNENDLEKFSKELAAFMYEHRIAGSNKFIILKDVNITDLNYGNYTDYYDVRFEVYHLKLSINKSSIIVTKSNRNVIEEYITEEYINKELD